MFTVRRACAVTALLSLVLASAVAPAAGTGPTPSSVVQVTERSFADPTLARFGDHYFMYATGRLIPVRRAGSPTGPYAKVTETGRALTEVPEWVGANAEGRYQLWAPSVFSVTDTDGRLYVMYFTGYSARQEKRCVGVAVSRSPASGFAGTGRPICSLQEDRQTIDPTPFRTSDGRRWMVFKSSVNNRRDFRIEAVSMGSLGISADLDTRRTLVAASAQKMEAPSLIRHGHRVFMFLARGDWLDCSYSTDVWSARTFLGPYERVNELMTSGSAGLCGPGGAAVATDDHVVRIVFHAYVSSDDGRQRRPVFIAELTWDGDGHPHLV
jgi:hypothetical protein